MGSFWVFSHRNWNLTAAVVGVLLVAYIGFLLGSNYLYQVELQKATLEQLVQDNEKRATAVGYFYTERKNDLRDLASNRAIAIFFENKALGMSMQYGLRASLVGITQIFDRLLKDKTLGGDSVYTRMVFLSEIGEVLVDCRLEGAKFTELKDWHGLLTPEESDATIMVKREPSADVLITIPYFFKSEYAGQIVAWVSPKTVYEHLIEVSTGLSRRLVFMVAFGGKVLVSSDTPADFEFSKLPDLKDFSSGKVHHFNLISRNGQKEEMLICIVPVGATPFSLVSIFPAAEVFGGTSPWKLPLAMAGLSLFLLLGMAYAWRTNARNLVLRANLEVAAKSKRAVEEKNQQLVREIAERKRVEAALSESEERYRRFFEEDLSGAFITNPEGLILACNPAFAEIFGFASVKDAKLVRVEQLYLEPEKRQLFLKTLIRERRLVNYESEYRRLDGATIQTVENVSGTFDENGELIEIKAFIIDHTERRKLEAQLRQSQKMEAIGTLAGGIAHDFNNILTAIVGNAEMALYKAPEGDRVRHNLEQVLKAGNRARDLVRQILAFSRQSKQERKPLQPSLIVKEALKLLRASLPTTIEIRQNIAADSAMILADPTQIHQVLMNLCTNASYAMRDKGGALEVSLKEVDYRSSALLQNYDMKPGRCVQLTVSDTGCGMDKNVLKRIFDPFYTTKGPGEGTGMGLAMVHGTVKSHGGAISVESEVGKGSRFDLFFPIVHSAVHEVHDDRLPVPKGGNLERILFVDDEDLVLNTGQQMFEFLGYEVITKGSSLEALAAFELEPYKYSLVITDQTMPRMTGAELAKELLQIRPEIPIILCTGFSEIIDQEIARSLGIREFVMKPFVFSELADIARKVLDEKA
jgi:two-component system, cell cycle sensor histidine kinase and response regulator CckA